MLAATRRATLNGALAVATPAAAQPGLTVVLLVHPGMVMLDLVGPQTVFALMGGALHLAWKDLVPVPTDIGLAVTPTTRLADAPQADVLFVPGGLGGTVAAMEDPDVLNFLKSQGEAARWVTSVCTGGLLLGAAGLLRGRRATTHWYVLRDLLPIFGATPVAERVVMDGNRVTGGGVTAGLDFGLRLAAAILGEDAAKRIQLVLEYAPDPPFGAGTPEGAGAALTGAVLARRAPVLAAARVAAERAVRRAAP